MKVLITTPASDHPVRAFGKEKPRRAARLGLPYGLAALFLLLTTPFIQAQAAPPEIERWERSSPNTDDPVYNVDSVTWRLQFNQWVDDVNNDFQLDNCSGCNLSISPSNGRGSVFHVTLTNIGSIAAHVTMSIRSNHDIRNSNGERLPNNRRHGTVVHEPVYTIRNRPYVRRIFRHDPTQYHTNANTLTFGYEFTEPMRNVDASDFYIQNSSADITSVTTSDNINYLLEVSGGNLADMNGELKIYLDRDHNLEDTDGHVLVTRSPQHGDERAYGIDNRAPLYRYMRRQDPTWQTTTGHSLTFLVRFDEDVVPQNKHFGLLNTNMTGSGTFIRSSASSVTKHQNSEREYLVNFNNLNNLDSYASIFLNERRPSSFRVPDKAGNRTSGAFYWTDRDDRNFYYTQWYDVDNIHPYITFRYWDAEDETYRDVGEYMTVRNPYVRMDWNEDVTNFVASDVQVSGGSIAFFNDDEDANRKFGMRLTAAAEGNVTISVPRNAAGDRLDNESVAFSKTVIFDWTAPRVNKIVRQSSLWRTPRLTNSDTLTWRVTFTESVRNVNAGDFTLLGGATGSFTVKEVEGTSGVRYDVTAKDGNLRNFNGEVWLGFKSGQNIADPAGHALTNTAVIGTNDDYLLDNTPPTVISITRQDPTSVESRSTARVTNSDAVTWRVSFSEPVRDVNAGDFTLSGATGTLTVAHASGSSQTRWDVTAADGNMANFDGVVTLGFDSDQNISDAIGNVLSNKTPTGTNDNDYLLDNTAPTVAIEGVPATASAPFTATLRFSETVSGFEVGDIAPTGASLSSFTATQAGRVWTVRVTPSADYRLAVAAGIASDAAGNGNVANDGEGAQGRYAAIVAEPENLTILEGSSGTFTVALAAVPTGTVTVSLTSQDTGAATVSPATLTYTTTNWSTVQTVTANGAEDDDATDETVTVTLGAQGGGYADVSATVTVTVADDDVSGAALTMAPESLTIAEGESGTFTAVLAVVPTGTVTVAVSSNHDEVVVDPASLTFTTSNWYVAQTGTVSAAEDDDAANDSATLSADPSGGGYGDLADSTMPVTVTDDDVSGAGLTITPESLTIAEGESEPFTAVLAVAPTGTVTVAVSSNHGEVTVDPASLTFTTSDWNVAQTGTVSTAEDDDATNDNAELTADPSSGGYDDLADGTLPVTVTDDDVSGAALMMAPASLTIAEGESETFTVALAVAPTGTVTVAVSSNHDEVGVNPASLTFTTSDWNVAQTGTVSAAEDDDAANDSATLTADPSGGGYGDLADGTLPVTVTDDDVSGAGLLMAPASLTIAEGESGTFTVTLAALPTGTVTVAVSSNHDEVAVNPASLTFTTSNWNVAQTGTASAAEDDDAANDSATLSADPSGGGYGDLVDGTLPVTVTDDDATGAGLLMAPESLTIAEGESGTFTVTLAAVPTGTVTVAVSSNHDEVTVNPASLTFTTSNWSVAQTGTVSAAEDDDAANDNATLSADPSGGGYGDLADGTLPVTVTDDDVAGAGLTLAPESLTIAEGESGTFTVALTAAPTGTVTVVISSNHDEVSVDPSSLTFTTSNWAAAQTGTVSAAEDNDAVNDSATLTADPSGGGYGDLADGTLPVTVTDDDAAGAGLTLAPESLTIAEGESGTFTVVLAAAPTGTVTVAISSDHDEVTVSSASLTFTTSNWSVAQTGTVSAAEDDDATNESAELTADPSGGGYGDLVDSFLPVTVTDDDAAGAGLTLTPESLTIAEGESETFTVVLAAVPTGTVTVAVSSNHGEVTVNPASLTFTTSNWNVAQTGTVSAAEDNDAANDSAILTADPSGGGYGDLADGTLPVTVTDDDAAGAGLTIAPESLTIAEGESGTFTVALAAVPTGTVTVAISSNHDEVTVSPASLTFTTSNWSTAQTVTTNAAEDDDAVNDSATLTADPSGGGYGDLADGTLPVTVTDDDAAGAGLTLAPASLTIAEGDSGTFTVVLAAVPLGTVTVAVSSDHGEVIVNPTSLTFTTANWDVAQTGVVSAAEDDDAMNESAELTADPSGGGYGDLADGTLPVTVTDDDAAGAGLVLAPESLTIAEGESGTFTVVLAAVPTGTVTVAVLSDHDEVTASPGSLTFTTSNWNVAQTGTVSAAEDDDAANDSATLTADPSGGGYGDLVDSFLPVTVTDDDAAGAGLTLAPESLTIAEGESGTFTVVLAAVPLGTVTVAVSSDHDEVTVNPASLTFTTSNWNVAQTGTVSAAEDADATNDSATLTADPSGGGYGDLADGTLPVTVTDDDAAGAGLTLAPESLTIAEGESGTFTVVLAAVPLGTVTVAVSSDHDEVTVNPASLTFTTSNWNVAQTGTVSAAEDADATNDSATLTADPSGGGYGDVADGTLPVTVTDDDAAGAGLTLAPESLTIAEGESGTFTVVLAAVPTGTVTVAVSSNHGEVTVSPTSLTFTTSNWNVAQTGTVSAAEDDDAANESATLTADPSGGGYGDLADSTLPVTVTDDDAAGAGLTLVPESLTIAEGESGTFTVVLAAVPTGTVTVAISSNHGEVTVSPASLTFTTSNWSVAQTGTVSAAEDDDAANDSATLTADPSGGGYGDLADGTLPVTVTDDDAAGAGLTLAPESLTIAEGESGTFTVVLAAVPTGTVTVAISSDHDEVTVSSTSLTFTTSNWSTAQTVTTNAAEDDDAVNDSAMLTADPSGGGYDDLADGTLPVMVTDDDAAGAGLTLAPASLTIAEGDSGTFTVVLAAVPTGTVTVAVSSDHGEVIVNPTSLTFTTSNWSVAQTGVVSAVEDDDALNESAMLTADPSGGGYDDLADGTLPVTVTDDDAAGAGLTLAPESLTIAEGESGTFTVVLAAVPTGTVTVAISSNHGEVTVNPTSLTFTTSNWDVAQTGTVSAAEDDDAVNDSAILTADPSGGGYGDLADGTLPVTVTDDDAAGAGLTLAPESLTIAEGESGTFTVVLAAVPTGTVTVAVSSDHDEVTVNPASLTFTTSNWSTAQTVTTNAAEDDDAANDSAMLTADPSGGGYDDLANSTLPVTVTDDDAAGAGLILAPTSLTITEGESGTFTAVLAAAPTGTVTVAVSSDHDEVSVNPASLTFTTSNWNVAQTGTVSAAEDEDAANDSATLTADPSGGGYDDLADGTLPVTVTDDDAAGAGLTIAPESLTIAEGESGTFTVVLAATPTGTVTVAVSSDHDEVAVSPVSLTFTTSNWNVAQTGTVSAAEDDDGTDESATLTADPSGGGYGDVADGTLPVTVTDDDAAGAGLTLAPESLTIAEGESGTFTVVLAAEPTGTVTVAVSSNHDEVTVDPASLTFTTSDWNVAQTGTVSAAEDDDTTNDSATLTADPSGGGYDDLADGTLPVTVTDDDASGAGLTLVPESLTIAEGESGTFTVVLAAVPTGMVTVAISSDHDEVTVDPVSLTFTTSDWNVAQTGTVSAVEDDDTVKDSATLTADPSGGGYGDVADGTLPVTVTDDDVSGAELTVEPASLTIPEGESKTFTVALAVAPMGTVTVAVSSDHDEVTINPASLTFTTTNWNVAQTGTVSTIEDDDATNDSATLTADPSGGGYGDLEDGALPVTVTDDDGSGEELTWEKKVVEEVLANASLGLLRSARDVLRQRFEAEPKTGLEMDFSSALRALETDSESQGRSAGMSEALGDSHFTLALDGESAQGPDWTLWGRGSYIDVEGEGRSDSEHEIDLQTAWLGLDRRFGDDVMGGVALSYADMEADYSLNPTGEALRKGELEMKLTTVHPYARWETSPGCVVWAMLGVGRGDVELTSDITDDKTIESDVDYWMVTVGGRELLNPMSGMALALVGDVGYARLETDATVEESAISDLRLESWQARGGIEAQGNWGDGVTPFGAIYGRYDGGDGAEGVGLELRGGLSLVQPASRLQLDIEGHWVAAHSENDYEEWGVSLMAAVLPAADHRGWSWQVRSGLGQEASDSSVLWGEEKLESLVETNQSHELSLSASVSWGFGWAGRGVLTPFAEAAMTSGEWSEAKLGLRYILPETERLSLELSLGQRQEEEIGNYIGVEVDLRN